MRSDINMPMSDSILRLKNSYDRWKNKLTEPKDVEHIDLSLKTSNEDNFVLFKGNDEIRLIIFVTIKNIEPLWCSAVIRWLMEHSACSIMFQAACISFALPFVFEKDTEAGLNLVKSNLNCNELDNYFYETYGTVH